MFLLQDDLSSKRKNVSFAVSYVVISIKFCFTHTLQLASTLLLINMQYRNRVFVHWYVVYVFTYTKAPILSCTSSTVHSNFHYNRSKNQLCCKYLKDTIA